MIPLNIKLDSSKGITLLSNIFIDQYMALANDAQIKIYLYLLRMVSANLPTDISEIADKFNHTEKDVIRSLKYWDELNLISLSYDEAGNITGISLRDLMTSASADAPTTLSNAIANSNVNVVKKTVPAPSIQKEIPMISMDYAKEREKYSLEDIKRLSNDKDVKMLLNAASIYFGRPLNPNEIKTILFIYDRLAFSLELTDYLIEYCVDHGQNSIHFIENVAINWYEQGIDSVSKAKQQSKKADKSSYQIMKALGKSGEPAANELEYIKKWIFTFGFSLPIIEEACQRTVLATDKNRFQYADSILKSWFNSDVHSKKDITRLDEEHSLLNKQKQTANKPSNNSNNSSGGTGFLNMHQQDYDIEAIEKALTR